MSQRQEKGGGNFIESKNKSHESEFKYNRPDHQDGIICIVGWPLFHQRAYWRMGNYCIDSCSYDAGNLFD